VATVPYTLFVSRLIGTTCPVKREVVNIFLPAQLMLVGRACPTDAIQAGKTYHRPLCLMLMHT